MNKHGSDRYASNFGALGGSSQLLQYDTRLCNITNIRMILNLSITNHEWYSTM